MKNFFPPQKKKKKSQESERIPLPSLTMVLETFVARRAVQFVQEIGLQNFVFEGDSEIFIQALRDERLLHSVFWSHYQRHFVFYQLSLSFSFSCINRQDNVLVDALVKRARFFSFLIVWMESIPLDLYNCYLIYMIFQHMNKIAQMAFFYLKKIVCIHKTLSQALYATSANTMLVFLPLQSMNNLNHPIVILPMNESRSH